MVNPVLILVWAVVAVVATVAAYVATRSDEESPVESDRERAPGFNEDATDLEAERHDEGAAEEKSHPGFNEDATDLEANRPPKGGDETDER